MTKIQELRKKAMALPEQPGVYIMKNASSEIIYIGKAKVLRNRVSQYFGSQNNHTVKVRRMVENVDDFDYIIVDSEFEALVLECSLIKQNKPKYNILLKDDKGYHYIRVSKDRWKSISAVKQKPDDNADYYGPYTGSDYVSAAVNQAADIFMLPHCSKNFPGCISRNSRPCLNFHIKLCSGACCGNISQNEHNASVEAALKFILGGKNAYVKQLKAEMNTAAEALEFEKAAKIRDRLKAIEKVSQKQTVVSVKCKEQDVFGLASIAEKSCLAVLKFRNGSLITTDTFVFDRIENVQEDYTELLSNYYSGDNDIPKRISVDADLQQKDFLDEYFTKLSGRKTEIYFAKAGEGLALTEMAQKNAEEKLSRILTFNDRKRSALHELQEALGLKEYPQYIEAYDISNTNGSENVAGMVVFKDGKPFRKSYRRFMIKSFEGQDDYRSLAEVMERRIHEYNLNAHEGEGFGVKPDLILLDGGIGQVNAVKPVLEKHNFDVPLFGMVKDGKHRTRAIATGGKELCINEKRSMFTLVSDIQEEVHRYAISYHHGLKKKHTLVLALTEIEFVGEKRAKSLLQRFKTLDAVKKASVQELLQVPGITKPAAESIYNYFSEQKRDDKK